MPATTTRTPAIDELLSLWHGDEHTSGYQHAELVVAVCDHMQPTNDLVVRARFYPGKASSEIDRAAARIIRSGYYCWRRRQTQR